MDSMVLSFHNDAKIKARYVARVDAHLEADEVIRGTYWLNGKGCAVGCTVHSGDHAAYETELGLPEWLARLEDGLFEGLKDRNAQRFVARFLSAIPVGVDLTPVKYKFCVFLLRENIKRVLTLKIAAKLQQKVVGALRTVLVVHERALRDRGWDEAAASAAQAEVKRAEIEAWDTEVAAWAAHVANFTTADSVAEAAALSARAATSAAQADVEAAAYQRYARKLLTLLKESRN